MLNPFSNKLLKGSIGGYMRLFSKIHAIFKPITSIGLPPGSLEGKVALVPGFLQRLIIKLDYEVID